MSWGPPYFPVGFQPPANFSSGDAIAREPEPASLFLAQFLDAFIQNSPEDRGPLSSALLREPRSRLGVLLQELPRESQDRLEAGLGKVLLAELGALSQETDPEMFWEQTLHLAQRLERSDRLEAAVVMLESIRERAAPSLSDLHRRAERDLNAILGQGEAGARFQFLLRRFAREASDPWMIAGFGAGSLVFKATRLSVLARAQGAFGEGAFSRQASAWLASAAGLGAEVPAFVLVSKLGREIGGEDQDWSRTALGHELSSVGITLFCLKGAGAASGRTLRTVQGLDPRLRLGAELGGVARLARAAVPQAGMFAGIVLARQAEEALHLRPVRDGATLFADSLATYFQFVVGGRLAAETLGPGFQSWQREAGARGARLAGGAAKVSFPGSPSWVPAMAGSAGSRGLAFQDWIRAPMMSENHGGDGSGKGPPGSPRLRIVRPKEVAPSEPAQAQPIPEALAPEKSEAITAEPGQQVLDLSAARVLRFRDRMNEQEKKFRAEVDAVMSGSASDRWWKKLETEVLAKLPAPQGEELRVGLMRLDPELRNVFTYAAGEYPWPILAKVFAEMKMVKLDPGQVPELPLPKPFDERFRDSLSQQLPADYRQLFSTPMPASPSELAAAMARVSEPSLTLLGHWTQNAYSRLLMAEKLGLPGLPPEATIVQAMRQWDSRTPESE